MKNWLLWMISIEAAVVGAMCMLIAVLAHGWGMLIAFCIAELCLQWLMLFARVNAATIGRQAKRTVKRMIERPVRRSTKEGKYNNPGIIIPFPAKKGK